jgi:hypothetical protein
MCAPPSGLSLAPLAGAAVSEIVGKFDLRYIVGGASVEPTNS